MLMVSTILDDTYTAMYISGKKDQYQLHYAGYAEGNVTASVQSCCFAVHKQCKAINYSQVCKEKHVNRIVPFFGMAVLQHEVSTSEQGGLVQWCKTGGDQYKLHMQQVLACDKQNTVQQRSENYL